MLLTLVLYCIYVLYCATAVRVVGIPADLVMRTLPAFRYAG